MLQVERIKGFRKTEGNGSDEAIQDTHPVAEVELFEPLPCPFGITRLKVEAISSQLGSENSLFLLITGTNENFHPSDHRNTNDERLYGSQPHSSPAVTPKDFDQNIRIQHQISVTHDSAALARKFRAYARLSPMSIRSLQIPNRGDRNNS